MTASFELQRANNMQHTPFILFTHRLTHTHACTINPVVHYEEVGTHTPDPEQASQKHCDAEEDDFIFGDWSHLPKSIAHCHCLKNGLFCAHTHTRTHVHTYSHTSQTHRLGVSMVRVFFWVCLCFPQKVLPNCLWLIMFFK